MKPAEMDLVVPQGWTPVIVAEHQPEYIPLPSLASADGRLCSRWTLTPEERAKVAAGADVYLMIWAMGGPQQPVMLSVGGASVEPIPLRSDATLQEQEGERLKGGPAVPPRPPGHKPVG